MSLGFDNSIYHSLFAVFCFGINPWKYALEKLQQQKTGMIERHLSVKVYERTDYWNHFLASQQFWWNEGILYDGIFCTYRLLQPFLTNNLIYWKSI